MAHPLPQVVLTRPRQTEPWRTFFGKEVDMSVTIAIPTALRQFAGGQTTIVVEATNAGEALNQLASQYAELRRHIFDQQNALRNCVSLYLNNEHIRHQSAASTPSKHPPMH